MGLADVLAKKQQDIVKKWFELVTATYQPDTAQFLKANPDQFANPVGSSLRTRLKGLVEELLGTMSTEAIRTHLDPIIRIRAVQQQFTPTQAAGFILFLKPILRETLKRELRDVAHLRELLDLEDRIDQMQLAAFDVFMRCREKIYELKANVERSTVYSAFRRAGLVDDEPDAADARENHN